MINESNEKQNTRAVAIVLAAGQGKRMGTDVAKQFLLLNDKPILYYSLAVFEKSSYIDEVILVTNPEGLSVCEEMVKEYDFTKVSSIVLGGKERYHSVWNGLQSARYEKDSTKVDAPKYVFIHDGARPFITEEIIKRNIDALQTDPACVTAVPSKDTVKIADEDGYVATTPKRSLVWNMQTPQSFDFTLAYDAYRQLIEKEDELLKAGVAITDDAMVVEYFTETKVKLVEGSYENIKITTPEDLKIAKEFL
jgi:2-C-methyl-D-erythritol 4-phosphate cytidylyltransferase